MKHDPKVEPLSGGIDEWAYSDGDVRAVLNSDGSSFCEILELSSFNPGRGHAKAAVLWLRDRFASLSVNDPGNEVDSPEAFGFWARMVDDGLIDKIIDGDGNALFAEGQWITDALDPEIYPALIENHVARKPRGYEAQPSPGPGG